MPDGTNQTIKLRALKGLNGTGIWKMGFHALYRTGIYQQKKQ
jgi:hypothetical protein